MPREQDMLLTLAAPVGSLEEAAVAGGRNGPMVGDEAGRAFPGRDITSLSGEVGLFCSNEEFSSQGLRATCRLAGSCHLERGGHCARPTSSVCSLEQPQDTAAHSSLCCGHSPPSPNSGGLEVESRPPHTGIIPCISFRASFSEFARAHRCPGNIHCILLRRSFCNSPRCP